jgi:hypothetical protein
MKCRGGSAYPPFSYGSNMAESGLKTSTFQGLFWRFQATKSMESFNEVNGIVERNQWNCSTKSMDLFRKTGRLMA